MDEMKISNDDHVIVYGKEGSFFTPRTWFLFRTMGHEEVHLMQGSFEEFRDAGGVVEDGPTKIPLAKDILEAADDRSTSYMATEPENVVNMEEMLGSLNSDEDVVVLDPRGSSFKKKGNIPGAIHLPYKKLVEPDNSLKLKSKEELLALFDEIGVEVDTDKTIITSCGSGVSVCHILLALEECGRSADKPTYMYDGSWQEYGSDPNTPKVLPQNFP